MSRSKQRSMVNACVLVLVSGVVEGCSPSSDESTRESQDDEASSSIVSEDSPVTPADVPEGVQVFDEDGATVILNLDPELPSGAWRVSDRPRLVIGQVDGAEPYLFSRIQYAQTLEDGRILVMNAGGGPIFRIFASDGNHIRSWGATGEGPGEFRIPNVQRVTADSILIQDAGLRRYTLLTGDGDLVRTWPFQGFGAAIQYLTQDRVIWIENGDLNAMPSGYNRLVRRLILGSLDGQKNDTLAVLAQGDHVVVERRRFPVPYSRNDVYAYHRITRSLITSGEGYDLLISPVDGGEITQIRVSRDPRRVTDQEWNRALDSDRASAEAHPLWGACTECPQVLEAAFGMMDGVTEMQSYDLITIDDTGGFWVRRFLPENELETADTREWWIFSSTGRWLTTMTLPVQLLPLEVGDSHLLARSTDELGVQRVHLYDLHK